MSGTSLDGVDIVLCKAKNSSFDLIYSSSYIFNKDLKKDILKTISLKTTLKNIGELDTRLGLMYAKQINKFLTTHNIKAKSVKAIGLHGQTLWHEPNSKFSFSMQLVNAGLVNVKTNIAVVSDFRQKDMALGGQGAPFTPAFHKYIFKNLAPRVGVLNIGGMANISILSKKLQGYDTGCGNVLMDLWIYKKQNKTYDKNGIWAKSGSVNKELLKSFLNEEFFSKPAPKSTGRELFNMAWLDDKLQTFKHLNSEDVQATLLELTALSIAKEVKKTTINFLIVCGGGLKNKQLMSRIKYHLKGLKVVSSDACGVSSTYMESMAFAWLAYKRINKQKVDLKTVTGAKKNTILGCIYE
jgi:anhydro-N-acetylmuramic acid kinase